MKAVEPGRKLCDDHQTGLDNERPHTRTLKRWRSAPLGRHQPDGAHWMHEIVQDGISPARVKIDAYGIASVATASVAQSDDHDTKQKTTFFDSIGQTKKNSR
jgi:hypothetical protein